MYLRHSPEFEFEEGEENVKTVFYPRKYLFKIVLFFGELPE